MGAVEGVESVERAGTRQTNSSTRDGAGNLKGLRKVQGGRVALVAVLARFIALVQGERTKLSERRPLGSPPLRQ